jgi:hypothetical protein
MHQDDFFLILVTFLSLRLPVAKHVDMTFNHILMSGYY